MYKKLVIGLSLLTIATIVYAQTFTGTPSQLRVLTDANNYLLVTASAQTLPISQPTVFSNTRLRTDSNNNLLAVLTGSVTPTFPLLAPTNCTTIPYSFTGRTTTGMCSPAADQVALYGGNTVLATFGIPSGALATSNFLNITGTFPGTLSAGIQGTSMIFTTSAGTDNVFIRGLNVQLMPGYTGVGTVAAIRTAHTVLGTGTNGWDGTGANYGLLNISPTGSTSGHNIGNFSSSFGSSALNIGVIGKGTSATNTPALNVGVAGQALSGTNNVAGLFTLVNGAVTVAETAALMADNGAVTANILALRDNGTTVTAFIDGGAMEMTEQTAPSAPVANKARLFSRDSGGGKTQLCAIFNTGAIQCFATEP